MPKLTTKKFLLSSLFVMSCVLTMQANACVRNCISASVHHTPVEIQAKKVVLAAVKNMTAKKTLPLSIDSPVLHEASFSNILKTMLADEDFAHITNNHLAHTTISETKNHFIIKQVFVANNSDYFMYFDRNYIVSIHKKTAEIQFFKHGLINNNTHLWVYSSEHNEKDSSTLIPKILGRRPLCKDNDYSQEPEEIEVEVDISKRSKGGCSQ